MEDGGPDEAQRNRVKKVQEKNKRAQARYRQKQKEKMQNFEGQCQALAEELDALKSAYNKLDEEKQAAEMSLKDPAVFLAQRSRQGPSEDAARPSQDQAPMPVRPIPQQSSGWAGYVGEQQMYDNFFRDLVAKSLGENQAKDLDSLVEDLKERLKYAEDRNSPDGSKSVVEVIQAMRQLGETYRERQPIMQCAVDRIATREKINTMYGSARPEIWKAVLDQARLSPQQLKRILELRIGYLAKIESLVKQRKDIVWELQQATAVSDSSGKRDEIYSKAVKLWEQLQDSLAQEHTAKEDLQKAVCHHVLSEIQEARMIVTAHPYQVDMASICDVIVSRPEFVSTCLGLDTDTTARGLNLPAILQIPAVLDSDGQTHMTPDMYLNAMSAWTGDAKNAARLPDNARSLMAPYLHAPNRISGSQPFSSASNGLSFNGGGRSSGFLPMTRQPTAQSKDTF